MSNSNMENYRKVEIVGKGSFGCAVLVQNVHDRKYYIMKIIDVSKMDRKQKEEALNEVTFLKAMRHPYIITYRESFMDKNRYLCIVMDYAEGGDMYSKINKQKKIGKGFPENQILDWFVQICLALKYVHDRKILHRDLKTQNIFLTAKGDIKIGDFGIARVLQDTYDCAQTAIGTPYYLSPEICQEKPYNQKSDIWSLGCILYELVTLRHAFDANSMKGLVLKILRGSYPAIPPSYSQDLKDLISEMLTRDPARRPSIKKILEKEFLASRISALVTNTIVKHELGNTLLKKVSPMPNPADPALSSKEQYTPSAQREGSYLSEKSSNILNGLHQPSEREKKSSREKESILSGLNDDKKGVNVTPNKPSSYIPTESTSRPDGYDSKKRSTSSSRHANEDSSRKSDAGSIKKTSEDEERKVDPTKYYSSRQASGQVAGQNGGYQKENKPVNASGERMLGKSLNKEEKEEQLKNLLIDFQDLNKHKYKSDSQKQKIESDDNENFEEDESNRVYARFLTIEGQEIPGCGGQEDTISYRIEALRVYLEKQVGEKPFFETYKILSDMSSGEDANNELIRVLGKTNMKFIPLIYQMIVCEDSYYGSN